MSNIKLIKGDSLLKLKELKDNSVDSIVTDPPYEIGFMGKKWDNTGIANNVELWKECMRVLKPGGHLLAFSHSRTYHRMAVAIEDSGLDIRDQILWIYGSGFPKSLNIGKSVDKLLGNEREVVGTRMVPDQRSGGINSQRTAEVGIKQRETIDTKGTSQYEGWGTALKPSHEPIVLARKPLSESTVAKNVLKHGTGGINIDGCRIGSEEIKSIATKSHSEEKVYGKFNGGVDVINKGRFPANIIFDEEAGKILDEQSGDSKSSKRGAHNNKKTEHNHSFTPPEAIYGDHNTYGDTGGASRFFYCPKTSKKDRNDGCDVLETKAIVGRDEGQDNTSIAFKARPSERKNNHPTVKPTELMAYLVRMVTPKGGTVLDPFMGSGSTGKAAVREGMNFIGIEREDEYMEISRARIEHEQGKNKHREFFKE